MFGYVRPLKGELKVSEFECFKAVYCGFCNTLARRFGFASRFLLNYDFTFLALVLFGLGGKKPEYEHKRCPASPFAKKCALITDPSLDLAADISVILTWWKLKDSARDDTFLSALKSRLAMLFIRRAYKKAARFNPEYAEAVRLAIAGLSEFEDKKEPSIDRPADAFARILESAADVIPDDKKRRPAGRMLYDVGRWIYIMDAADDLDEDLKTGSYNPVALRYGISKGEGLGAAKDSVDITAAHSISGACAAFELLDFGPLKGIIYNILYLGLPFVQKNVLEKTWRTRNERPI